MFRRRANKPRLSRPFVPIADEEMLEEDTDVEMTEAPTYIEPMSSLKPDDPNPIPAGSHPEVMSLDNTVDSDPGVNMPLDLSGNTATDGQEECLVGLRGILLKVIFKRKRFAPALYEELGNANDTTTLQTLLDLVASKLESKLDQCNIGMAGLLRVEGYLPGVHSLRKSDADFVGCCMAGRVRHPTIELEWADFLRAVADAGSGGGGYEGDDEGDSTRFTAMRTGALGRSRRSKASLTGVARVMLFFC